MGDFFQNGLVTTFHSFGERGSEELAAEVKYHAQKRPVSLVLPSLYSELLGNALPRIVERLKEVDYLTSIVVTLGVATEDEFNRAKEFFAQLPQKVEIIWNDGPRMMELKQLLAAESIFMGDPGKGLAAWFAYGLLLADGEAEVIALHDCDIETYDPLLLHRLVYPLVHPELNYSFSKGYYARYTDRLHGRVTRLFVTPLVRAFAKVLGPTPLLEYFDSFRYPLAGEFAMTTEVAKNSSFPGDWGLEIGTLAEQYRNLSLDKICQVDLEIAYDHKHQAHSIGTPSKGLMRMAREVGLAFIMALGTDGVVITRDLLSTLHSVYLQEARESIRKYKGVALINGLGFDEHREGLMAEAFGRQLTQAGEVFLENPMGSPPMPQWSRVPGGIPRVYEILREIVTLDEKG